VPSFCRSSFSFRASIQTLGKANTGKVYGSVADRLKLKIHIQGKNVPFISVVLRPDSWSWPPHTGLRDHIHWTQQTREDSSARMINLSQRPLPDNTQRSQGTYIHTSGEIRTHNPRKRAAADPNLRPHGHWHRQICI
jgi:hypothetical protein